MPHASRASLAWWLLAASLVANAALIGHVVLAPHEASPGGSPGEKASVPAEIASAMKNRDAAARISSETWRKAYSEDLPTLAANLRTAGLPDRLVRAIVGAEINERFKAREDALKPKRAPDNYWESQDYYDRQADDTLELRLARLDLRREKDAFRASLLGEEAPKAGENNPIPPAKRDAVRRINEDYDTMIQQVESESRGMPLAADREKLAYLRAEKDKELRELLSPEEYEANQLRTSRIAQSMRWELAAFKPSEEEFVLIHNLRAADPELSRNADNSYTSEDWQRRRDAEKRLGEALRRELGDERYQDYVRGKNYDYRQLTQLASRFSLAREDVNRIYDQKKTVPEAALATAKDPKLSREQKEAALKELAAKARETIYAKLGQEAGEAYLRNSNGNNWIKSLENGTIIVQTDENSWRHHSLDEFAPREPQKKATAAK